MNNLENMSMEDLYKLLKQKKIEESQLYNQQMSLKILRNDEAL